MAGGGLAAYELRTGHGRARSASPHRAGKAGVAVAAYELPTGHGRDSFGSGTRQMPAFLTPF